MSKNKNKTIVQDLQAKLAGAESDRNYAARRAECAERMADKEFEKRVAAEDARAAAQEHAEETGRKALKVVESATKAVVASLSKPTESELADATVVDAAKDVAEATILRRAAERAYRTAKRNLDDAVAWENEAKRRLAADSE
jgi:hypothetical protein